MIIGVLETFRDTKIDDRTPQLFHKIFFVYTTRTDIFVK